jgi:hypothetical protein
MFSTLYNLQYHLSDHSTDDEDSTGISIAEIKNIISQIALGIKWGMVLN